MKWKLGVKTVDDKWDYITVILDSIENLVDYVSGMIKDENVSKITIERCKE